MERYLSAGGVSFVGGVGRGDPNLRFMSWPCKVYRKRLTVHTAYFPPGSSSEALPGESSCQNPANISAPRAAGGVVSFCAINLRAAFVLLFLAPDCLDEPQ